VHRVRSNAFPLLSLSPSPSSAWEATTLLKPRNGNEIVALIGDDREGAPLLLYVGEKIRNGNFLERNGFAKGKLYAWVPDDPDIKTPEDWNGRGSQPGEFVEIQHYNPDLAEDYSCQDAEDPDYDRDGFACQDKQDELVFDVAGAFRFSRPEDVATNPKNRRQAVFASTGRERRFPSDSWGTVYIVDVDMSSSTDTIRATVTILIDTDAAAVPDEGVRSPDNLDWADDGYIYVQEDKSYDAGFGVTSGEEASIWKVDPLTGDITRIYQIDRSAVPPDQTDPAPIVIGDWETSGILDVTSLFPKPNNKEWDRLLVADVQAHTLRDGNIGGSANLVQGGQLLFLKKKAKSAKNLRG